MYWKFVIRSHPVLTGLSLLARCLQCFETAGWAMGIASGQEKMPLNGHVCVPVLATPKLAAVYQLTMRVSSDIPDTS